MDEWLLVLWGQLSSGTFNGVGNVVLDSDVAQSEQHILADIEAIDRILLGSKDVENLLSDVQTFAENQSFNPGIDPVVGTPIEQTAESLAQVMQYVYQAGLPDLVVEIEELKLDEVAAAGDKGELEVKVRNQGGLRTNHPVMIKAYASQSGQLDETAIEIGEHSWDKLDLKPNKEKKVKVKFELPESLPSGDYRLFTVVDVTDQVPEADESNNVTAVFDLQQIVGTQPSSPEPSSSNVPFTIRAEGKVTINGNSDLDGDPLLLEDDALLYGGEGFKLHGQPVLPVQRTADGNPVFDADGRPVLVDRAVAVSADYTEAKVSNNQYSNILPPQVVETEMVTVPDHDAVVAAALAQQVPAGITPITFDLRGVPLYNQQKWNENFPAGGTPEQPAVIRVIGGGLNIPHEVDLEN
ncbi:MAG: CARDB domain-containing protein, partial [Pseudomonadota bacterium]